MNRITRVAPHSKTAALRTAHYELFCLCFNVDTCAEDLTRKRRVTLKEQGAVSQIKNSGSQEEKVQDLQF